MIAYEKDKLPVPILEGHEDWINLYYMAWETAFTNIEYPDRAGWKPQLSCMPGTGIVWLWDSCFMTFITNYSNGALSAFNNLDNIYRLQRKSDGYISMAYRMSTDSEAYGERINPPIAAWAEWQHYLVTGDGSRLPSVAGVLENFYDYIEKTHRRDCGLYWFEDPGSSGMDNAPRGGYAAKHLDGSDVCHVDLACQQSLSAACIAKIYAALGNERKVRFYSEEATRINDLINRRHWSDRAGYYFDFFARSCVKDKVKWINSKTAAAFWALLCGCADTRQTEQMVKHLFAQNEFYTPVPFCTLARDDPNYDPTGGYWLGGVWAPANYVAIRALVQNGYGTLAREAAQKYLAAMASVANNPAYGGIWEAYCPEQSRPSTTETGELVRKHFVGWSGLAPITILIETIIGLSLDASENTLTLTLSQENHCGIKNLLFNGYKLSVEYTRRRQDRDYFIVNVETEQTFRLIVKDGNSADRTFFVPRGKISYEI